MILLWQREGYKCSINIGDIQEVQLFDEMPKDNFTRTNGGSTDEYDVGNYKGRTYGKCMLLYGMIILRCL